MTLPQVFISTQVKANLTLGNSMDIVTVGKYALVSFTMDTFTLTMGNYMHDTQVLRHNSVCSV